MITTHDLISLPFTPDLTQAGIAYACRSLPHTYDRMGGSPLERMRRITAGVAVELAFRRRLDTLRLSHDSLGATPFTDPDHYDVALGGRRCDLKSFQFFHKKDILRLRRDPNLLLQAAALVPVDQAASNRLQDHDLYIFAFVSALVTRDAKELHRAQQARQPVFFLAPLLKAWARPNVWAPLGPLTLKSECQEELWVELGGQGPDRGFIAERVTLPPRVPVQAHGEFFSLAYLHAAQVPSRRVGIRSRVQGITQVVNPGEWGNIWVYGIEINLAGYMSLGEFRQRARFLPAGSQVLQYNRTRTDNLALAVEELHPMAELFDAAKEWQTH